MSILQDILGWAQELPVWQSDAIARLFANPSLSRDDLEDLYALLKAEHGVPDPKGRVARKLDADQIPIASATGDRVEVLAIKNLRHVNAIAENKRLVFGQKGLTIIYGANGSGKSGYSRVLKRACRARDQNEPVHPHVNLPGFGTAILGRIIRAILTVKKLVMFAVSLMAIVSGCSSVISNSESYYQNQPRRPINWREYLTD